MAGKKLTSTLQPMQEAFVMSALQMLRVGHSATRGRPDCTEQSLRGNTRAPAESKRMTKERRRKERNLTEQNRRKHNKKYISTAQTRKKDLKPKSKEKTKINNTYRDRRQIAKHRPLTAVKKVEAKEKP